MLAGKFATWVLLPPAWEVTLINTAWPVVLINLAVYLPCG